MTTDTLHAASRAYYEAQPLTFSEYDADRIAYRNTSPADARAIAAEKHAEARRVEKRMAAERTMIRKAVRGLLAKGYAISVWDGEAYPVKRSRKLTQILAAVQSTDEERLIVRDADGERLGSVLLVYGNADDGSEVIADYSVTLADVLDVVTA